ncbi:MAG: hypothetical protein APG10_01469 [Candidatus Methanofastidiosum methylothiophilum]|uniref:Uncharacterized protein n=1 Tax=Candidatus Methanofastidiosum methylothiophilum TaxID=1705564 RepID=A0A150IIE5_9EURY|nr:MAG: hypothetical protein APG10_01469 [Candidatus Methanofastidiosum methylthiophilus]
MGESTSFNEEINNLFLENNLILTFNSVESLSLIEKNKYVELIDFLKERCKVFVDCNDIKDFLKDVEEIQAPFLDPGAKSREPSTLLPAHLCGECHSPVENLQDFERTLSQSPQALCTPFQPDCRNLQPGTPSQ